jgi:UrcA family protein
MSASLARRARPAAVFGAIGLGLLCGGAALAQNEAVGPALPTPSDLSGVTVTAPRTIEQNRDGVTLQVVSMSVHVPYGDLDMHSAAGAAELDKRVTKAADYICNSLASMYPNGYPETFFCAKQAVSDAQPQLIKAKAPG